MPKFYESVRASIDTLLAGVVVNSRTTAADRIAGETQIIAVPISEAANAGIITVATITSQPCLIKSIVVWTGTVMDIDFTSAAIEGGEGQVVEFIDAATSSSSLGLTDSQAGWTGAAYLPATKTITIDLQGTGSGLVIVTVTIEYVSCIDGGYLV